MPEDVEQQIVNEVGNGPMSTNRKNAKALNKVIRCNTMMEKESFLGSSLILPVEL